MIATNPATAPLAASLAAGGTDAAYITGEEGGPGMDAHVGRMSATDLG